MPCCRYLQRESCCELEMDGSVEHILNRNEVRCWLPPLHDTHRAIPGGQIRSHEDGWKGLLAQAQAVTG